MNEQIVKRHLLHKYNAVLKTSREHRELNSATMSTAWQMTNAANDSARETIEALWLTMGFDARELEERAGMVFGMYGLRFGDNADLWKVQWLDPKSEDGGQWEDAKIVRPMPFLAAVLDADELIADQFDAKLVFVGNDR